MSERTPGPWRAVEKQNLWGERYWQLMAGDLFLGQVDGDNAVWLREGVAEANAEFIVRACNSHDALVEACAAVLPILPYWGVSSEALRARIADDGVEQWPHIERVLQLRAALAIAITLGADR